MSRSGFDGPKVSRRDFSFGVAAALAAAAPAIDESLSAKAQRSPGGQSFYEQRAMSSMALWRAASRRRL